MATATSMKTFTGTSLKTSSASCRTRPSLVIVASGSKTDLKKMGMNTVKDPVVQKNLMGISESMKDKNWVDSQGRKGKGYGVYRFADKYGANVDGYSPIYTPDLWSKSGSEYKLGTKGIVAWLGLLVVLLAVGVNLVISTSQLGA